MNLTKEEAIRRYRMMWEWIANETLRRHECVDKLNAFKHFGWNWLEVKNICWCCEYCNRNCNICPIEWPSTRNHKSDCVQYIFGGFADDGLYLKWLSNMRKNDWRTAAYYALYISMLPERKE